MEDPATSFEIHPLGRWNILIFSGLFGSSFVLILISLVQFFLILEWIFQFFHIFSFPIANPNQYLFVLCSLFFSFLAMPSNPDAGWTFDAFDDGSAKSESFSLFLFFFSLFLKISFLVGNP